MRGGQRRSELALFIGALLVCHCGERAGFGQTPPKIEDIVKVWEERQARVQSGRFAWTEEVTRTIGSVTKGFGRTTSVIPPKDNTYRSLRRLAFDHDKISYEYTAREWSEQKQRFIDTSDRATFDGKVGKTLSPPGFVDYPMGAIRKEDYFIHFAVMHIRPILMAYRATYEKIGPYHGGPFKLTGMRPVHQGRPCLEVEALGRRGGRNLLWIDPARDFNAVRCEYRDGLAIIWSVTVDYRKDDQHGWIPSAWRVTNFDRDGSTLMTSRATVSSVEINPTCAKEEFEIEFPVGTVVFDDIHNTHNVQTRDRSLHVMTPAEHMMPIEQLLDAKPSSRWRRLYSWPVITGGAVLVAVAVVLVYRRRKERIPDRQA